MKWAILIVLCAAGPVLADGVDTALGDPAVVPILRAPSAGASNDATPLNAANGAFAGPHAQRPVGPTRIAGYPIKIAWGHAAVAAALLGGMYLFGESEAASSTN